MPARSAVYEQRFWPAFSFSLPHEFIQLALFYFETLVTHRVGGDAIGQQTKQLYKTLIDLLNKQANQPKPENKPLDYLTTQALQGADLLKSRDYRDLGKNGNMFFDFQLPAEQMKQRELYANANQTGTFAMSDNAGAGQATALQSQFLKDRAAHDSSQGFQDNIQRAAGNIQGGLASAAGGVAGANDAETQRQMAIMNSFADLYKFKKSTNQAASSAIWGSVIGGAATAASAGMGAINRK